MDTQSLERDSQFESHMSVEREDSTQKSNLKKGNKGNAPVTRSPKSQNSIEEGLQHAMKHKYSPREIIKKSSFPKDIAAASHVIITTCSPAPEQKSSSFNLKQS